MVPSQGVPHKCQGSVPHEIEEPLWVEPREFASLGLPFPLQEVEEEREKKKKKKKRKRKRKRKKKEEDHFQGVPYKCQGFVPHEIEEPRCIEPRKFAALGLPPPLQEAEAVLMLLDAPADEATSASYRVILVKNTRINTTSKTNFGKLCGLEFEQRGLHCGVAREEGQGTKQAHLIMPLLHSFWCGTVVLAKKICKLLFAGLQKDGRAGRQSILSEKSFRVILDDL
ncbi:hypothetical protein ACMD2_00881 [Ananas comosus]|uniref:Uncharacterized protein n=1 Tax=Ananas comosus TaxID=4615 RepID=A0A199UMB7_ANACO|nr:hypothetical protein ACMD2_00881 [Ananas comosus]